MNKDYTVDRIWQIDGNLLDEFRAAGYGRLEWIPGQVRTIPADLARKARMSGATVIAAEEGMTPEVWREPTQPVPMSEADTVAKYVKQYQAEPHLTVMCLTGLTDGNLREQFAALNRPPELGVNEIVTLPKSLIELCISSGAAFTNNPDEQFQGHYQKRFEIKLKEWREEVAARQLKAQAEQQALQESERRGEVAALAQAKIIKKLGLTPEEAAALGWTT